jgi:hypothetical protein
MAKTRKRDEKFRLVTVRVPESRNAELEAAAKEIGLKPAPFILVELMKSLNARKGILPADTQSSIDKL